MTDEAEVLEHLHAVYGQGARLVGFKRLHGGARKQLYSVRVENADARCVMYVWDNQARYFADREEAGFEETQTDTEAPYLFDANTRFLLEHGIRVPSVIYRGTLESGHEFAFVEEVDGTHWSIYAATAEPAERAEVLQRIGEQVSALHSIRRSSPGTPTNAPGIPPLTVERTAERTLWELKALAQTNPDVMRHVDRIGDRVTELRDRVSPRTEFTLVHGELPHHILIRHHDREVFLVDVEGLWFFDIEVDHVQLELFWPEADYRALARDDLDPARMDFYTFCWHVSCAYAGSRLLSGGFPDQQLAQRIYENNLRRTLALL